jgi:hypothetical protein
MRRRPGKNQLVITDVDGETAVTTEGFDRVLHTVLDAEIEVFPARSFYPSSLGHPCDRNIVWRFNRWKEQDRHDPVLQSIFDQGNDYQPLIYQRLEEMGFEIVRESDRPTQYRTHGAVISGRPDGRIVSFRGYRYKPSLILEAKSMSGYQWDKTLTLEDLRHSSSHWTRSYYAQGQLYAFLENVPRGAFALYSKATGMMRLIPFELDYAFAESLLKRVEKLQPMIEQGVDPEPLPYDQSICGSCGFRRQCYPPKSFGEGASVITDPLLLEDLVERERLKDAAAEYKALDESIKDRLKMLGTKWAIAGDFVIEGKPRKDGVVVYTIEKRLP